jgi:hypothetical protein
MGDSVVRCPVGSERVDEYAARVNGGIVFTLAALSLWTPLRWLLVYLFIDFAIKVVFGFAYSPNCIPARQIANLLHLPFRPVPAAPKRFAGALALVFIGGALVSWYSVGSWVAFAAFVGVLLVCAFLESALGYCIGCAVYGLLPANISKSFVR